MKAKLLKKLRREAKSEFYIVDYPYKTYRYRVKSPMHLKDEYWDSFPNLEDAVKKLKLLRREYMLERMECLRRKVLDL